MLTVQLPTDKFLQPQFEQLATTDELALDELMLASVQQPLDYPPLQESVFPGDSVALVVQADLQSPERCLTSAIRTLIGLFPEIRIEVVISPDLGWNAEKLQEIQRPFDSESTKVQFQIHDPENEQEMGYAAASQSGEPIYVNRVVLDSDVVIPFTSPMLTENDDQLTLYPEFGNSETRTRLRRFEQPDDALRGEIRLANYSVGAHFMIAAIAGPGGQIHQVLSGATESVGRQAANQARSLWNLERQPDGQVVIATIESTPERQTWEQFIAAVNTAARSVDTPRQIVVCTQLNSSPPKEIQSLLQMQFETDGEAIDQNLQALPPALQSIPGIMEDCAIYLRSQLDQDEVEELGLGHIESDAELQRIIDRAESGVLIRDAHRCNIL